MKRLECLDGLRGVLAVYVMLGHVAPFATIPGWIAGPLSHGGAAVDVFFILSGLVIVQSLESFGWRARGFLIARVARTYPVYLTMLALAVAVQALPVDFARMPWIPAGSQARDIWSGGWPRGWVIEIASHLTMTHGLLPDAVVPGGWVSFLGSAWSLSTEWQFYVLALLLGARIGPGKLVVAFLGLAIAGLAWRLAAAGLAWHPAGDGLAWRLAGDGAGLHPARDGAAWPLAGDGVAWPLAGDGLAWPLASDSLAWPLSGDGVARPGMAPVGWEFSRAFLPNKAQFFALGIASAGVVRGGITWRYGAVLAVTLVICAAGGRGEKMLPALVWTLCLAAQLRPDVAGLHWLAAVLRSRFALWLGALSYCIYLTNEPVHKLLGLGLASVAGGDGALFSALWLPGAVLLPLALSAGLHAWVEVPALRWGRGWARRVAAADCDTSPAAAPPLAHRAAWRTPPVSLTQARQPGDRHP